MATDYERGFRDGVQRAAQKVCRLCQQGWKLENREIPRTDGSSKVYLCHQHPDGHWEVCAAMEIRALTPGYWRQLPLTPETMAALFHEGYTRLAPKFKYKIRDDSHTALTRVNRYQTALQYIATHTKDRNTRDDAIDALAEGEPLQLWDPLPWDQAYERNRKLTIAVCAEMLEKFGTA